MASLSKDWNIVVGVVLLLVGAASVVGCYTKVDNKYLKPIGCLGGTGLFVFGLLVLIKKTPWDVEDYDELDYDSDSDLYENASELGGNDIDMEDAGIEEVVAMRSGLAAKEAPVSGPGMSGQPGDYVASGGVVGPAGAAAALAPSSGMLGADIPEDELAAWSGLQNPGSSETMLISHQDMIGIDSVGQTKRNMTRDIRGEPVIQPGYTGPFGQSTITRGDLDNVFLTTPGVSLPSGM